jgi:hypothetical protein
MPRNAFYVWDFTPPSRVQRPSCKGVRELMVQYWRDSYTYASVKPTTCMHYEARRTLKQIQML